MFHGHSDHIQPNDTSDEEVQVVAGTQVVDKEPEAGVVGVIGLALGFWWGQEKRVEQTSGTVPHTPPPTSPPCRQPLRQC